MKRIRVRHSDLLNNNADNSSVKGFSKIMKTENTSIEFDTWNIHAYTCRCISIYPKAYAYMRKANVKHALLLI